MQKYFSLQIPLCTRSIHAIGCLGIYIYMTKWIDALIANYNLRTDLSGYIWPLTQEGMFLELRTCSDIMSFVFIVVVFLLHIEGSPTQDNYPHCLVKSLTLQRTFWRESLHIRAIDWGSDHGFYDLFSSCNRKFGWSRISAYSKPFYHHTITASWGRECLFNASSRITLQGSGNSKPLLISAKPTHQTTLHGFSAMRFGLDPEYQIAASPHNTTAPVMHLFCQNRTGRFVH